MANVTVLIGAQWGDEGKGKWSDHLSRNADIVARFQGGNNAGHTIYRDGKKLVLHQVPCGFGDKNQLLALTSGVVINPVELVKEMAQLESIDGASVTDRLLLSEGSSVITPWHIHLDHHNEENSSKKIGTTKRGIGPAYRDRVSRVGLKLYEYVSPSLSKKWLESMNQSSERFYDFYQKNPELWEEFFSAQETLRPLVTDVEHKLRGEICGGSKDIFLEGAQGALLDINHGTYPYVTSSSTIAAAAACSIGFNPRLINKIYGVAKAYVTRVGEGCFPTEEMGADGETLGVKGKEFGATTNRKRRCGWFDAVAMRYAQAMNGFDSVLLNKLDILSGFSTIKVARAYVSKGVIKSIISLLFSSPKTI